MASLPFSTLLPKFDCTGRRAVIAAVSGGSDSVALLLLAKAHLERTGTKLVAVTIDHGLRAESADEAAGVARLCAAEGIEHRTFRWTGPKPGTGIPAAAREARYRLLAQAADEADTDLVLTGHTKDDQAETIAMRRRRGEGRGLAGMAPATLYAGRTWIARPLLGNRRDDLRAFLRGRGIDWIDDPTNRDTTYERARTRATGVAMSGEDIARAARERVALSERVAALVRQRAVLVSPGLVRLAPEFAGNDKQAGIEALRILLAVMGGGEHLADAGRTAALFAGLAEPRRATLSRCMVDVRRGGIFLHREGRGLPAPTPLRSGTIWDGRFLVSGEGGTLEPFGPDRARAFVAGGQTDALESAQMRKVETPDMTQMRQQQRDSMQTPQSLVRAALAAWPAMRNEAGEAVPLGPPVPREGPSATPLLSPWVRFLPSFDLAAARAVAELVGAPKMPASPFAGHIAIEA
ncbi:tRNA lysidine(34) synthetase TilS [Mesorhizobium sp. 1B3]|uniref:tRNA lysidine(34) synthetase TilS n=1 Tax=Mesorhizobium sp. 1B3 TaxID=3243599 RepID=UPI003D96DA32